MSRLSRGSGWQVRSPRRGRRPGLAEVGELQSSIADRVGFSQMHSSCLQGPGPTARSAGGPLTDRPCQPVDGTEERMLPRRRDQSIALLAETCIC
jgi:hypothetical protein